MAAIGDDCYFFCTSTCAKGAACPFRHVESAKTNKIICQHWQTIGCYRPMCKFRHSDFHIQVNYNEIPCYWESQPVGCSKANCAYKHIKPQPDFGKIATTQAKSKSPEQKDGTNKTDESKEGVDKFVMPTVKPIIIDPESEASNSSPVKKPFLKETSEEEEETQKEIESSNSEKNIVGTDEKGKGEKAVKVGGKKKKARVLTPKNGKLGAAKGAKKVKKKADGGPAMKVPVKRQMVEDSVTDTKPAVPAKKKLKERLGVKDPTGVPVPKKKGDPSDEDESSSSDSDDSIENVKVLSMEEIFRQKALESMMKKRAAEGKPMLPEYEPPKKKSAVVKPQPSKSPVKSRPSKPAIVKRRKKPVLIVSRPQKQDLVRKNRPMPLSPQESESEDGDEEEDESVEENDRVAVKEESEEEEESSSSESESSSSDSSESEVRRVVINVDEEKAAREKAKASLLKNRQMGMIASNKAVKKRKVIREEPMPLSRNATSSVQQRLSIKERLGLPTSAVSSLISRKVKKKEISSEDESEESDKGEKVDLLKEKLNRLGNSPIKDRLGPSKTSDVEDETTGRQILISEDVPLPKKARRRPWSSVGRQNKTKLACQELVGEEDQRTVSAISPDVKKPDEISLIDDSDEPESLYESVKRRALMKTSEQVQENNSAETKADESDEAGEDHIGKRKKHKHKHKHKKHKKSKSERQIYVPPPKKSVITEVLERVKKVPSLLPQQDDIPEYQEDSIIDQSTSSTNSTATSAQPRAKPRAAAMWAAGLSVSSKGLGGRPHFKVEAQRLDSGADSIVANVPTQKALLTSKMSTSALSSMSAKDSGSSVPVVKTFSQIMAEKRQKRQQTQESCTGDDVNLSSSPSRISSKTDSTRPKVPITPITFDLDGESKGNQPSRPKPTISSQLNRKAPSLSPPPAKITTSVQFQRSAMNPKNILSSFGSPKSASAVPLSDIKPAYKTSRIKKLNWIAGTSTTAQLEHSPTSISTISTPDPPAHSSSLSSVISETSSSSSTNRQHHHRKSLENTSDPVASGDAAVALKSPTSDLIKYRRTSTVSESNSKLDDEFSIFDGGDEIEDIADILGKDVEPIDDLLADIDDLLA